MELAEEMGVATHLRVTGEPTDQGTVTVHLPAEQRFNSAALREMLDAE